MQVRKQQLELDVGARFGSTYTKIGTIQRRLAWPLLKDDTQIREAFHIKKKKKEEELDMEQQTSSKFGMEYVKAVYCHPAYLTYMQSTS